jgi:hypothetical protein
LLFTAVLPAGGCGQTSEPIHRLPAEVPIRLVANPGGAEGAYNKPAIDPVAVNGPIFVDWPQPSVALVISGDMDGYLEPCGCAGLDNQKGGLKRRHSLLKQMAEQGWPTVALDAGGLSKRRGPQAEIKYRRALEALVQLGYSAIGLGPHELQLSSDALVYTLANMDPAANPVVSANVGIFDFDSDFSARYRVVEAGGKRIGVTGVLGASHQEVASSDILFEPPANALARIAPELAAKNCDLQVLMVQGTADEAAELARQFPQFELVVTAGGAEEPPSHPGRFEGAKALRIEVGHKGMYVVVIGIYDDPKTPLRYQRVPLDARFGDSPEMNAVMAAYQKELEQMTLEGLGLKGSVHPEGEFIGSEACADCHTEATEVFLKTPHAHATDTLVKLDPPRHHDPECLSCHVTGWNPQQYFPYASGYMSLDTTPALRQNGCENCHGPGAAHVAAESGEEEVSDAEQEARREALRLKILANEGNKEGQVFENGRVVRMCMECHDLDNSPDFDFQAYWPHVAHEGKD